MPIQSFEFPRMRKKTSCEFVIGKFIEILTKHLGGKYAKFKKAFKKFC